MRPWAAVPVAKSSAPMPIERRHASGSAVPFQANGIRPGSGDGTPSPGGSLAARQVVPAIPHFSYCGDLFKLSTGGRSPRGIPRLHAQAHHADLYPIPLPTGTGEECGAWPDGAGGPVYSTSPHRGEVGRRPGEGRTRRVASWLPSPARWCSAFSTSPHRDC
jgi:hypothetical protein